ncbi:transcriptional regulator SutA [Azomonas agilis]|nr:transcriptional regulator SutA [Azomonas agilis]
MNEEELEQDDLEMTPEEEGEEPLSEAADGAADEEDDAEGDAAIDSAERVTPSKKSKSTDEVEDLPTPEAKQKDRDELARAMEEFLARGGTIQEIEPNVVADPPKKPDSKYGSRPI